MIDNLFAHQKHFKPDSGEMPLSDFCLISSTSHNPHQNDSGSVPQGNWGMGMHCTTRATYILPDKSIISLQSGFFKIVESRPISTGVQLSWFMVVGKLWNMLNKHCGWSNRVMKLQKTDKYQGLRTTADQCTWREELLLPSCGHLNTIQLLRLPTRAIAQGMIRTNRLYYPF